MAEQAADDRCPSCDHEIKDDWAMCPICRTYLKRKCPGCGRTLKVHWTACPYCHNGEHHDTGYCTSCGKELPEGGRFCPYCGTDSPESSFGVYAATGGQIPNSDIMAEGRDSLRGRWWHSVGTLVVLAIILIVAESFWIASVIVTGPLYVGWAIFVLAISRGHEARLSQIFGGFNSFLTALAAYWLFTVIVLLWSILLIIPGIIAALSYSQIFFIIADDRSIGPIQALRKSKEIMNGHRWKLFCLFLRFIGWFVLCILTLGIGFLWLIPYITVSCARFYDDINMEREPVSMWSP